jgi:CHAT domain-containing protein/tetratricopeptide (TPR) repeat protein
MPTTGKLLWTAALLTALFAHALASPPSSLQADYQKANHYFDLTHPTAATDSMALQLYTRIIDRAGSAHFPDDWLFQCWLNKGVLLDVKGRYHEALDTYNGGLGCLRRHPEWSDSLYFRIYIYAGPDYYHLDNFDSAYSLLNRADELALRFPGLREKDRLYNALGALYYESGNYLQARNYFSRALDVIRQERPNDRASVINFSNNIASCLYKLGDYQASIDLYTRLIGNGIFSSQLYFNLGKSYIELRDYANAMTWFRQVRPGDVPDVYNEMAYTQFLLGKNDSSLAFLDQWSHISDPAARTSLDAGVNDLYRGQVLMAIHHPDEGMKAFQQAIITFSGRFANPDIHSNPLNFTGSFSSYRLFDAILSKAKAWEWLYTQLRKEDYLLGAWQAYNSAILLFRHIEKTYATDDARLFLKKNNRDLYHNAFEVGLSLDKLHPNDGYLEQAFGIAEKSKASILAANLDISSGHPPGIDPRIVQRIRTIKYNIARLEVRGYPGHDSISAASIASRKVGYEIELSQLLNGMERNTAWYKLKFEDSSLSVAGIRGQLRPREALISLYLTQEGLHIFTLTNSAFHHLLIDSPQSLTAQVKEWLAMLNDPTPGHRFGNRPLEKLLYTRLVQPLTRELADYNEWIIIPDDIFSLLPFESLPADELSTPLIETRTISYQLSAKLLRHAWTTTRLPSRYAVLSFAPFADSGKWVDLSPARFMDRLPSSGQEIGGLPGNRFLDRTATKAQFLREINHFPVIHLATHAISAPDPQASLICFYPQHKGPGEDGLYLPELYGLNLDSTDLVILSTCESGKGEIADNEGVMSLSRGFLYAGCASTVNSLWKADDQSTEIILQKFHVYLEKGYSKSTALRQAKLDYIHGNAVYTTPNYWAHLILVGNTDPITLEEKNKGLKWGLIAGLLMLFPLLIGWRTSFGKPRSLDAQDPKV